MSVRQERKSLQEQEVKDGAASKLGRKKSATRSEAPLSVDVRPPDLPSAQESPRPQTPECSSRMARKTEGASKPKRNKRRRESRRQVGPVERTSPGVARSLQRRGQCAMVGGRAAVAHVRRLAVAARRSVRAWPPSQPQVSTRPCPSAPTRERAALASAAHERQASSKRDPGDARPGRQARENEGVGERRGDSKGVSVWLSEVTRP